MTNLAQKMREEAHKKVDSDYSLYNGMSSETTDQIVNDVIVATCSEVEKTVAEANWRDTESVKRDVIKKTTSLKKQAGGK